MSQTIIFCVLQLLLISCLQYKLKVNTLFAGVLYINCTEENQFAIRSHEFMLQTCKSLLEKFCFLNTVLSLLQHH